MKLFFLIVLCMAFAMPALSHGGDCDDVFNAAGDVDIQDIHGSPGQTVQVVVTTTKTGIAGADLTLNFDPSVFAFTGTNDNILAGNVFNFPLIASNLNNASQGTLRIALVSAQNSQNSGVLVSFPLTISANHNTVNSAITLSAILNDVNSNIIAATVGNGVASVGECGRVSRQGDVNGDGKVDLTDVRAVVHGVLVGFLTGSPLSADMNSDGVVDITDIRKLLKLAMTGVG
jgi:hypothetical protein